MSFLILESDQSEVLKFEADRHTREFSTRLKNAARAAVIPFLAGAIGAFIPVVHFVLVPGAFIAMIFLGTRELTTHFSFTALNVKCPHCAGTYADIEFERLPKRVPCFHCHVTSTLSEAT